MKRRWAEHTKRAGNKGAKFFRTSKPVSIVFVKTEVNRSLASREEARIKKLTKQKKLQLIESTENQFNEFNFN